MKKTFQIIGLISLTIFSFFITDKTATVVNNMDDIMVEIKANKDSKKTNPIDAVISENTIIPGIRGKTVNINKSYKNMKKNGYYSEKLFIYDYTKPKISLIDNIDKYIIKGNPNKRMVSLIFRLSNNDNIVDIVSILNNYNAKSTFFVDESWFNSNNNKIQELINSGHIVAPYLEDYSSASFEWMDILIKKVNKQSTNFCYSTEDNQINLENCINRNNYTIRPITISESTPLIDIKGKLEPGSLLSLKINSELKKELSTIIIYIKSKGYTITNLEENVLE